MSFFAELCTTTVAGTGSKLVSLFCGLKFDQLLDPCLLQGSSSAAGLSISISSQMLRFAAEYFEDRTDVQCLHRWQKVLNPELVKGPWTKEVTFMHVELCAFHAFKAYTFAGG